MTKRQTSGLPGCAKEVASALAFLTAIAWLMGALPRPKKRKGGAR